jgi:hypothetical protein
MYRMYRCFILYVFRTIYKHFGNTILQLLTVFCFNNNLSVINY